MGLRLAKTGQLLIGDSIWAAETEKTVVLAQGGPWPKGRYTLAGIPVVKQLDTILIDGVVDNEDYTIVIGGQTFTIDSGAGASAGSIRTALRAAIDGVSGLAVTADNGAASIDITALAAGTGFSLSETTSGGGATMSISAQTFEGAALNQFGLVDQQSGAMVLRAPAAFTGCLPIMVAA